MFSDFIKHYNNIRGILRNVFLYGCFSREALENKNVVSARKVSYEIRRIQQYIESEFIKIDQEGRNKLLSLSYDSITNTKNFLVNTYLSKSFTKADITLYFYLLLVLNIAKDPLTFNEIEEELVSRELIDYEGISSKTIERKLKEICDLGILACEKKGRCKAYRVSNDTLGELSNDELHRLFLVKSLYKNLIYPTISGYYCEDTLRDYMTYERGIDLFYEDCFQYKNLHFHPIIEEELLWKCINAINNKNYIVTEVDNNLYRYKKNGGQVLKPVKIRYDANHGRFYLLSFNNENKCVVARLDRVDNIVVRKETFNDDTLEEKYIKTMEKSWSSVPVHNDVSLVLVILKVIIKDPKDMYILGKIKVEMKTYNEEIIAEGEYILKKEVADPTEMIPWLRSYGPYIKVMAPRRLARRLKRDWKEALNQYGVV